MGKLVGSVQPPLDRDALARLIDDAVRSDDFRRATFAGPLRGAAADWPWLRVVVRPLLIRDVRHLQFSYFDRKKDVSKNFTTGDS